MFRPTFWDWSTYVGTIGLFLTLFFLFVRLLGRFAGSLALTFKALGGAFAVAKLLVAELARRDVAPNATTAELEAGAHRAVRGRPHRRPARRKGPSVNRYCFLLQVRLGCALYL